MDSAGGVRIIHTVYHVAKARVEPAYESVSRSSTWTTSHEEVVYRKDKTWEDEPWKAHALDYLGMNESEPYASP